MTEDVGDVKISPTEIVHVAGKAHVKELLHIIDDFYGKGGETPSLGRRGTINLEKLSKAPVQTVDRLTGEGGEMFDLEKAYGERLNRLLTSYRNDPFYEGKHRAYQRFKGNKTAAQKYNDLVQRKMKTHNASAPLDAEDEGSYTNQVVASNLEKIKKQITVIRSQHPHLSVIGKERVGLEYVDNLDIDEMEAPFE